MQPQLGLWSMDYAHTSPCSEAGHAYNINLTQVMRDENHPLVRLQDKQPHSMVLVIRPHNPRNNTFIRYP